MRKQIDKIVSQTLIALMGVMVINVLWQVFTRFLDIPSSWTDELARFLLIWVGVLGVAYTSGKKMHLALDLIPDSWGKDFSKNLNLVTYVLIILFALAVMVVGGARLVYVTFVLGQNSPVLQIPLGLIYSIIPISGFLIIYYKLYDLIIRDND